MFYSSVRYAYFPRAYVVMRGDVFPPRARLCNRLSAPDLTAMKRMNANMDLTLTLILILITNPDPYSNPTPNYY